MTGPSTTSPLLQRPCTVFHGQRRLASGPLSTVVLRAKTAFDRGGTVLIFDDATSAVVDVDYSGTGDEILRSLAARVSTRDECSEPTPEPRGPGRPRLGVVAREVTLLPRHWAWLSGQPGGASVALRRLVDDARRANVGKDRVRRSQEGAYRVMVALGGDLPGFEEAIRGLFAGDRERFDRHITTWPADVRRYVQARAEDAFGTRKVAP